MLRVKHSAILRDVILVRTPPLALVEALSAHLVGASSATKALRAWCEEHDLAEGEIVTRQHGQDTRPGLELSEADNWFVPRRLSASLRDALQ